MSAASNDQGEPRVAVLASGEGTTAETLIKANLQKDVKATVKLVISSRAEAGIVERIARLNKTYGLSIDCRVINGKTHPAASGELVSAGAQTDAEEGTILKLLKDGNFDLIVLLGYMKKVGPRLIEAFGCQPGYTSPYQAMMVNTHPGLLPETKGLYGIHVQQYVLDKKLEYAGQTFHLVAEKYDEGPVISDHRIKVKLDDTAETLFERVKATEKQYIARDIDSFIKNRRQYLSDKK